MNLQASAVDEPKAEAYEALKLFSVLQLLDESIDPECCKLHLATLNEVGENPLDEYRHGRFDEWQTYQTQKNFERDMVVSLIALPERDHWLFAGVHDVQGRTQSVNPNPKFSGRLLYQYSMEKRPLVNSLCGRLSVHFKRPGRRSYLCAERWDYDLRVVEMFRAPLQ